MTKFLYRKTLGLFMVIVGFSYCLTSFYNFYDYIFGDKILANSNIIIMSLGLLFPLFTFIFGIYFYFYHDKKFAYINPFIIVVSIMMLIVGISRVFVNNGIMQFIHTSFAVPMLVFGLLLILGCLKYKY